MSLENRDKIRPIGCVSKNCMGACKMPLKRIMCRTLAAMSPEISGTKSAPNAPRAVNKFIKYFKDLTAQVQNSFHTIHSQETKKRVRA